MRVVCQRVGRASVAVSGEQVASIGPGLLLLVGIGADDTETDVATAVEKIAGLRIFSDDRGRMNLSVEDVGGDVLVVSQFTLLADVRRGRRPSYTDAAPPEIAAPLVAAIADGLRRRGIASAEGVFGAKMDVELVNDGPVTLVLDIAQGRMC